MEQYIKPTAERGVINLDSDINSRFYNAKKNVRIQISLIIIIIIITTLFFSILITRNLTQPVKKLIKGIKAVAVGNLNVRIKINSPTEISELASTFNQMAIDIKTSHNNLEKERDKIKSIVTYLTDGVIVVDNKMRLSLINSKAEKILGFKKEEQGEIIGKKVEKIMLKNNQYFYNNLARIVFINSKQSNAKRIPGSSWDVYEIVINQPEEIILKVTTTDIYDAKGKVFGSMRILYDITRERAIDQMKSEFISVAAHQLRTPLSSIKWVIKMVLDGDTGELNKDQQELLSKGYASNERVIKLVNDLLNVSRIEEGKFGFEFKEGNFQEVLDVAINNIEKEVAKNHLKLKLNKSGKLPMVYMDKDRIIIVLQNLLDNAVKYTPEHGKIEINIETISKFLKVTVQDNGVGIPKNDQAKLFSKFFRAANVMRMQTEGSGLGLFIARNIIKRHGGKVTIISQEGKGTKVSFTLPIKNK